jgi:hypothetical protein
MNLYFKKCVWLISKLIIAAVGLLNICLLIQDLKGDMTRSTVETVICYGILLILNSKLMCDVISKSSGCEGLIFFWAIFYLTCLIINTIMMSSTNSVNFFMPVISGTATNYIIYLIGLDQHSRGTTGFLISAAIICTVITFHLFIIVSEVPADVDRQRLPVYYLREQVHGLARDRPPRYSSRENMPVPPDYNTALLHAVVANETLTRN